MNADTLLQHFDLISEAPDAIPKLRGFVLNLAVRGKLAEQDDNDPASELLKRINAERTQLINQGGIKKQVLLMPVEVQAQPFDIPTSWEWVRFGELVDFSAGKTPSRNDSSYWNTGDHAWVSIADMVDGGDIVSTKETVSEKARNQVFKSEPNPAGSLIMSFKLTIGKISKLGIPAFHNEAIISIRPHVLAMDPYLMKILPQFSMLGDTKDAVKGATLNRGSLSNLVLPIPPLAEQHRIVAKVDELMALCDQLEAEKAEREQTRGRLVSSSLHYLNPPTEDEEANKPEALKEHARFVFSNLPRLTTRPEHIKQLRGTILDLAVRGKLVEQDPTDEPASEFLTKIKAQKAILWPKQKATQDANKEYGKPFQLPVEWEWSQLAEIGLLSPRNVAESEFNASFVPMTLIPSEYGLPHKQEIKPWGEMKSGYTHFSEGDVALAKITPCFENGKSTVFRDLTGGMGAGTTELHVVRPLFVDPDFILIFLKCPYFIETGIPLMTGTAGQKRVPKGYFAYSPFPLPPLSEQHRIVEKVSELMTLCDQLEEQIKTAEMDNRRLLESTLYEALEYNMQEALS